MSMSMIEKSQHELEAAAVLFAEGRVSPAGLAKAALSLAVAHIVQNATEEFAACVVRDAHVSIDCLDRPYERDRAALEILRNAACITSPHNRSSSTSATSS